MILQATQLRVQFVKDEAERDRIWDEQHERAADRVYALCYDLKGFFLKVCIRNQSVQRVKLVYLEYPLFFVGIFVILFLLQTPSVAYFVNVSFTPTSLG